LSAGKLTIEILAFLAATSVNPKLSAVLRQVHATKPWQFRISTTADERTGICPGTAFDISVVGAMPLAVQQKDYRQRRELSLQRQRHNLFARVGNYYYVPVHQI
jgi:hypothetical protein